MKQPSLDILMNHADSKYTLVVAAAKRARVLMANLDINDFKDTKPVSRALAEIAGGKVDSTFFDKVDSDVSR
ncbi:DNA-directed RNA polymerase subunit omega [Dehalobacter sp. DCM]|uniref:DNA-directed RNA polymerase subunit omega n=1 Tax=Dehalobacter sp. DCM TaxID=2907827 RepID=UPI0030821545|nr:DNA-directed RNA polymerase subunit omega [Dehalobacter sp. DCM]